MGEEYTYSDVLDANHYKAERDAALEKLKRIKEAIDESIEDNQNALLLLERDELREKLARAEKKVANLHERLVKHTTREKRLGKEIERLNWLLGCRKRDISKLSARAMPEGYRWPKYEDHEPVMFGDEVEHRHGTCTVDSVRFYNGGGVTVYGEDDAGRPVVVTEPVMRDPIVRAVPKVIAADGEPLEVGQTVYDINSGTELTVTQFMTANKVKPLTVKLDATSGTWTYREPGQLTHQRPVLDADSERIETGMDVWWVCEGDERGVHAEKLYVESVGSDGLVECSPYNGGTWVELEPSELYVHKPVLDADGVPIKVGDMVYGAVEGGPFAVTEVSEKGGVFIDAFPGLVMHSTMLTHAKPEHDSWERIEHDATLSPEVYCHANGIDISQKDGTEIFLADTVEPMARDIVRRCKKLAGVDE